MVGRPGARFGELSSPSTIACDLGQNGKHRVYATSMVGVTDRRLMVFNHETWAIMQSQVAHEAPAQ